MSEFGKALLEISKRLGPSWQDLADFFDTPPVDRGAFKQGREARDLINWLRNRGKLQEIEQALIAIDRKDLIDLAKDLILAAGLVQANGSPSPAPEAPTICSQTWLQTPGKAPNLLRFYVGDDGELKKAPPREESNCDSFLPETDGSRGSLALSPNGSVIALLIQSRLQLHVVDTKEGITYKLPYPSDLIDVSRNARLLAVTRGGNREVSIAVQDEDGAKLLRISVKETKILQDRKTPEYKIATAAFLGQDLLYVQSSETGEGQTTVCGRLRQWGRARGDATELDCPVFLPLPGFGDWGSLPVIAVDVAVMGGQTFVALLVAALSHGTEFKAEECSLYWAPIDFIPGKWKWNQLYGVAPTARSVNIVRNPYGRGDLLKIWVGTELVKVSI